MRNIEGFEILPADPEGWWAMPLDSIDPDEWAWGETPSAAMKALGEDV